ncbi:hypothetical protein B0O80DRAFT_162397 [Mortierella sp. GBAus27b]|nr:hypothetical protein B0O80DRAFT_162397 [Mortierella sp. GBAus27b]
MHPTSHSSFVPDLDMNPPPAWSKPASALGLNNPLSHLPQSQQIRQLQEQIQQHRRLQHQQSHGYGLGGHSMKKKNSQNTASGANNNGNNNSNNNSNSNKGNTGTSSSNSGIAKTSTTNTDQDRSSAFQLQGHQHINIMNTDDMSGDEDIEEDDEDDEDDDKSDDRSNQSSHHRNASHPQLTQGFAIPGGFASFAPSSPLSPSSPGSIASDSSSMTSSMLSPGLLSTSTSGYPHHQQQHSHGHGSGSGGSIHGIETSLASLASLTVISPSSGGSSSATSVPMSMPNASRGRNIFSPHQTNPLDSTSPTTSSFQPQSLPMMYQGHGNAFMTTPTVTGGQTPSFSAFSSALTHHLQKQQQQQQQQMTSGTMSSSLPTHTNFNPFHQPPSQQPSQPQSPQMQHQPLSRSRSKSLTIPAPRIIPPLRALPPRPLQASAPRKYHGRQTRKQANSPLPPKEPVDPTRRVAHIISEQKRREKINGGFDELKSVIPE